ncbi:unnamed protein product [Phytomonas sp. Hart1]|nr:unnamed protein product [Phytomonas sp. Hart1]|eukprot:CCW70889.1 unnamed protein product [Phytomonas sp. isolate Hart1]
MDNNSEKRQEEFDYSSSFIMDSSILLNEIRRIENSSKAISRTLTTMVMCNDDEDILSRAPDLCNDIEENEKDLFSPIPDYVTQILNTERQRRLNMSKKAQPHVESHQSNYPITPRLSGESRAYVDPSVPLLLPYEIRHSRKFRLGKNRAIGTNHNLHHGDESQCVLTPSQDNKRIQIETKKNSKSVASNGKTQKYEPPSRKPMKVSKDFVPSCAYAKKGDLRNESN